MIMYETNLVTVVSRNSYTLSMTVKFLLSPRFSSYHLVVARISYEFFCNAYSNLSCCFVARQPFDAYINHHAVPQQKVIEKMCDVTLFLEYLVSK
jgi:hypothetical protein